MQLTLTDSSMFLPLAHRVETCHYSGDDCSCCAGITVQDVDLSLEKSKCGEGFCIKPQDCPGKAGSNWRHTTAQTFRNFTLHCPTNPKAEMDQFHDLVYYSSVCLSFFLHYFLCHPMKNLP